MRKYWTAGLIAFAVALGGLELQASQPGERIRQAIPLSELSSLTPRETLLNHVRTAGLRNRGSALPHSSEKPDWRHDPSTLLFTRSDSASALRASARELQRNPADLNAQLVRMEAARIQLETAVDLSAALALVKAGNDSDPRAELAAHRIRELAANTAEFRAALPELERLARRGDRLSVPLNDALLLAASDGAAVNAPRNPVHLIRTWRIAGPFGRYSNVAFEQSWKPEIDLLRNHAHGSKISELISVPDGKLQLPDYFARSGIYYAAANLPARSGNVELTVESEGTYALQVDGTQRLRHDARFVQRSAVSRATMALTPGRHRLLLKFLPSAVPIRVWVRPVTTDNSCHDQPCGTRRSFMEENTAESRYVRLANAQLDGEPPSSDIPASKKSNLSSITELLRGEILARAGNDDAARAAFIEAANRDPNNLRAVFQAAELAFADERWEEAATRLNAVVKRAPAYWPAQKLKYDLANHFGWKREQEDSLVARLKLHPNCAALLDASNFYAEAGNLDQAEANQQHLATCSPAPFDYWQQLSQSGRHADALSSLEQFVARHPLNRRALVTAVRQAVLSDDSQAALRLAAQLHRVAPNSRWTALIAANPQSVLDSGAQPTMGTLGFYRAYVRDALPLLQKQGGDDSDALLLVNDAVVKLDSSGGAWVYRHIVRQVFNKKGVEEAGEVELPRLADLLVLRTVKSNGSFIEPEPNDNKATISMPSLEPGDAIEISYLQRFSSDTLAVSPNLLDFIFTDDDAPTRSARFTVLRDGAPEPLLWTSPEVGAPSANPQTKALTWEMANQPEPPHEANAPATELRPQIRWLAMDKTNAPDPSLQYRDELIQATQITPRIERLANSIRRASVKEEVAAAYELVRSSIQDQGESWQGGSLTSADDSFQQGQGNRAAALVALLSAMHFPADLELAAERGRDDGKDQCFYLCYTHALVRVSVPNSEPLLLDPESDGIAAGALSPEIEGEPALLLGRAATQGTATVVPRDTNQRSVAVADLRLDNQGQLSGTLRVCFGSMRAAQIRAALRQFSAEERQNYLEEIAGRIFPGAHGVVGDFDNEDDAERPLNLTLHISEAGFAWGSTVLEMPQFAPPLALTRMYASLPHREQSLLIDVPLVEDARFNVHLPPEFATRELPDSVHIKSKFGYYDAEFHKQTRNDIEIVRSFNIPCQIVPAENYVKFLKFAREIDAIERRTITIERATVTRASAVH
ncbi:MAG TPA: hypothetical protein VFQ00_00460 [Terriglobales bacterium]|nr:hypothetical protein [Terriglobales bacterium]